MKKVSAFIVVLTSIFFFTKCEKQELTKINLESESLELSKLSVIGLVTTSTTFTMLNMMSDLDPIVQLKNENLMVLSQAFQQIACDNSFMNTIGQAVNNDLEFNVIEYLDANPSYKTTVENWITTNGYSVQNVMLQNIDETPWIYASNYGVHNLSETPALALGIEQSSTVLGTLDDFIPCYYSTSNCNSYQVGLVGLDSDLGPEDPSLPATELVLIFTGPILDEYGKKEKVNFGSTSDSQGTVISPGSCNELGSNYIIEKMYFVQDFNDNSSKIKIQGKYEYSSTCGLPIPAKDTNDPDINNPWVKRYGWADSSPFRVLLKGAYSSIGNQINNLNLEIDISDPNNDDLYEANSGISYHAIGILFERDWWNKSKGFMTVSNLNSCGVIPQVIEFKLKSKYAHEVYVGFYIYADWCLNEVRRFYCPPGVNGDQAAFIEVACRP